MSIRLKLLVGCLCLTAITMVVGLFAQSSQRTIGELAVKIYDDSLLSTSALRSAQTAMIRMETGLRLQWDVREASAGEGLSAAQADYLRTEVSGIAADLAVASEGSISLNGKNAIEAIRRDLAKIRAVDGKITTRLLSKQFAAIDGALDSAVKIFDADAFGVRRDVDELIDIFVGRTWVGMAIAMGVALAISFLLSWTIIPALRNAMKIAKSIAEGNFNNEIVSHGHSETAELLDALSLMQDSISKQLGTIETQAQTQAFAYDGHIALQNARFEAALDNMTQGLCMFDAGSKLVVHNRRFVEMFGEIEAGLSLRDLGKTPQMTAILSSGDRGYATHRVDGGRMIAVFRKKIAAGGEVITFEDVTERHQATERMAHLINYDTLTGLPNRLQLRDRLEHILVSGAWQPGTAVFCLDLDGFKFVNDTLGHPVGDALLAAVAERLRSTVGPQDFIARTGGDEFAVVQFGALRPSDVKTLASRIIAALGAPFDIANQRVAIGVSIGIVTAGGERDRPQTMTADILMKNADLALDAAKNYGRNTFRFFKPAMDEEVQFRRRTEIDLGVALERGEFELYYQPFVNVMQRQVTGFEALLRWTHPERGPVSPSEFIPIAESVGLIQPIGLWVLDTACRQAALWPSDLVVSVNLSPIQFRTSTLYEDIARILKASSLPPSRLQLEITENVLLQDTAAVLEVLTALRKLGIRISMDDFGTGYSSLGYLSKFPFDKVKIDQSFVRDLGKRENIAVVRAVIGLSKAMGIAVIAEGVETKEQRATLLAEGCDEMQGYHFSRPRPVSDLPQLLMRFGTGQMVERAAPGPRAAAADRPAPAAKVARMH